MLVTAGPIACAGPVVGRGAAAAPIVDLGYSVYRGVYNETSGLNTYRGIRFAALPQRWQLPEAPTVDRTSVLEAVNDPPRCPQSLPGPTPAVVNFNASILGDEDCLFLNVFSPKGASKLPVVVWIHGGGYGAGSSTSFDFSYINRATNNSFVAVTIQYRLGAFGFLSSAEVAKHGVVNAGLHDMRFALDWVQQHIAKFGGDPDQVTISGESAGGGAVMLMAMANGGAEGNSLFRRGIASSPYFPTQPKHDDGLPTDYFLQFARRANCLNETQQHPMPTDGSLFACLQSADTILLQNASAYTSYAAKFGQWAFIPVTDGALIQAQPNEQLLAGKVNGERILAGNNANEGTYFVPKNITTRSTFLAWLQLTYPSLTPSAVTSVLALYAVPDNFSSSSIPKFETTGLPPGPYATTVSGSATGWQQAANNLYAETTFVCPAYWLADAYSPSNKTTNHSAWRYQLSVPNAFHGVDLAFLGSQQSSSSGMGAVSQAFRTGFMQIWGRFIVRGEPNLDLGQGNNGGLVAAGRESWLPWGRKTGTGAGGGGSGVFGLLNVNITADVPGRPDWSVVDGLGFEGGRGARCALWAEVGVR
ncbi:putative carboxylesterase [Podospora didyma]|uniref:Carboxylic ester hydrolase n=1 Tax=Podospora didyma TaxID=330526 RepID=A0AAE0U973_9PEZI|nr:putative carboxylesterase [Podospora didyma]